MNKKWTKTEIQTLKKDAKNGATTKEICRNTGRTKSAIRSKASREKISLKPRDKK